MSNSFETALDNVKLLARLYEEEPNAGKLNEAQTRFTYIDNMLFDVLGWDRHDCVVEDRLDGRIADYSLSAPHRIFIVEAKRTSIGFILPATAPGTRIWKIRTLESEHPEIFAAIQQAAGYTSQRGTPFGAVTNGHQFIGFLGSRTGPSRGRRG